MNTAPDPREPLLQVRNLKKYFPIRSKGIRRKVIDTLKAVDDVSFDLHAGETLGIVGESGCGKTTCARAILRAIDPTGGEVWYRTRAGERVNLATLPARRLTPLRREMQMIFQDPMSSLNPRMTVTDIVAEPMVIHGIGTAKERIARVEAMLERVGLQPRHRQRYPHAFSGGQRQRIGIARALMLNPRLVVCDEAVSALDVSVQAQVINLLEDLQKEFALTYIFVAHDLSVVRHICNRVAVMYFGKVVEMGDAETLFTNPRHPYTQSLLSAIPYPDPRKKMNPLRYDPKRNALIAQ
ncbi:MAG TPA: ATP-binding cassette domain-containing protein [Kiritimatiellia bacterium]|nr:ATP-binding cassette domain-containing protein [Kiritimatiellia bacterium]